MLPENNSIILVDDREEDLKRLSSIFGDRGIGCRSFQYDGFSFPEQPLQGVRMVFMDINLSNSGDRTSQFAVLVEALQKYVSIDNSYYVLIFWTTHTDDIDDFKAFVNRDGAAESVPKPMLIVPLDKNQFVDEQNALEDKLTEIFNDRLVKCLFSFDGSIQIAANKCLTDIVNLAPFSDNWGENAQFETNVRNLFTTIAIESAGLKPAKSNPDKAIKEVIAPSFLYDMTELSQDTWKEFLNMEGRTDDELKNLHFAEEKTGAMLNTILNIDPSTEVVDSRGSVRKMRIDKDAKEFFKNAFAVTVEDFIKTKMVSMTDSKFETEATVVAVEISAACDYSNDKPRLHRYIMGILAKRKDFQDHVSKRKTELLGNHIFIVPFDIIYDNEVYCLVFNLNYTFNEEKTDLFNKLGDKIFGFKSDFMNSISEHYAQHISRVGYASFR